MDLKIWKFYYMNRTIIILLSFVFLINSNVFTAQPTTSAKTAIIVDYDSGEVIYSLEPDMSIYPASMTKIMTSIVAFDLLKSGKLSFARKNRRPRLRPHL